MRRIAVRWTRTKLPLALVAGLILLALPARAQAERQGEVRLRGQVVEGPSGIPDVHVLNLTAATATISDEAGFFAIGAIAGDTLLFSAVRYRRKTLVVAEALLGELPLRVPMDPFVNELDEVVVTPFDLSGDLDNDLGRLPEKQRVTAYSLGLPNAYATRRTHTEKLLNEATTGGGIVPLNPILNYFTGRTRMLKKQLALERSYQKAMDMRSRFPDSVFIHELGIPQPRIPDFMYYCEVDSVFQEVADSGDRLRVWAFLQRKSGEYRTNNGLD